VTGDTISFIATDPGVGFGPAGADPKLPSTRSK